ncbi:outer membrane beta-barrel protein [Pseudomonas sp. PSKL.D1]|uniref:outer membrane beta-barrel protein n=1 Tax=Pseudomonas sp. PSKL.D1 TaxID=3029060 RepID=UPI002380C5EC|nr:outer membrane beta-barrel protein [Pseudomonas sp. PSKL.D1]WDY59360.1 hypothetical protein PVV54_06945 [Pseudomonas sp. PSKL.D1]
MHKRNLLRHTCLLALMGAPFAANAAPSTEPRFVIGALGAYDEFTFHGGRQSQSEHVGEGGIFASFGNKMTAEAGLVYQVGAEGKYAERDDYKFKDARAAVDLGWRVAMDARNFADVIVGVGYTWQRFELVSHNLDTDLTYKSPFAKAALGYNHQFDAATLRVEAGVRHTFDGRVKLDVEDFGDDTGDMKDRTNPYAEVTLLMNQQGDFPIQAGVYYIRSNYELDDQSLLADNTELKRNEYGVKLGIAF